VGPTEFETDFLSVLAGESAFSLIHLFKLYIKFQEIY
jgi:hypothetical protein